MFRKKNRHQSYKKRAKWKLVAKCIKHITKMWFDEMFHAPFFSPLSFSFSLRPFKFVLMPVSRCFSVCVCFSFFILAILQMLPFKLFSICYNKCKERKNQCLFMHMPPIIYRYLCLSYGSRKLCLMRDVGTWCLHYKTENKKQDETTR